MTDGKSISLRVPNAIFFITGTETPEVPKIGRNSCIWPGPTCIAVGCTPDADGETQIVIAASEQMPLAEPAFDGALETPDHVVSVEIVPGTKVLEKSVAGTISRIRIWVNHPVEPNNVVIGVG